MSEWHTISARLTSEEKAKLDELEKKYGFPHNQSIRKGIELLGSFLALGEFYASTDHKALERISKEVYRCQKELDKRIKELIKKYPDEFTGEQYATIENAMQQTLDPWGIFSQERKRGRKSEKLSRGKPRI